MPVYSYQKNRIDGPSTKNVIRYVGKIQVTHRFTVMHLA